MRKRIDEEDEGCQDKASQRRGKKRGVSEEVRGEYRVGVG